MTFAECRSTLQCIQILSFELFRVPKWQCNLITRHTFSFPPLLCLTQLFHSASGVVPLILAWHGGKEADGILLVNLICESKNIFCFPQYPVIGSLILVCSDTAVVKVKSEGEVVCVAGVQQRTPGFTMRGTCERMQTQHWRPNTHKHRLQAALVRNVNRCWTSAWLHLD